MRLAPRNDTVFALCLSAAIAILCLGLAATGCSRPLPDLGKIGRAQYSRTVHSGSDTCQAWLPIVVRASVGQEFVALALEASQPWANSLGMALLVPAVGDEPSGLDILVRPCPVEKASDKFPYCAVTAQTAGACVDSVYKQTVTLFYVGSAATLVATLTHEIGHALGVDPLNEQHSANTRSIMFKTTPLAVSASAPFEQGVTPEDAAQARAVWGLK